MSIGIQAGSNVLFLGPHTDDIEICVGSVASRLIREGCSCTYVAFSDCVESVPQGFGPDALRKEAFEASSVLGFAPDRVHISDFPVRHFDSFRQEILEYMVALRKTVAPDVVFAPSTYDFHQDHEVIAHESIRAFKAATLLGYEAPWNNITSRQDFFVEVTDADLKLQKDAVSKFQSQIFRTYTGTDQLDALAQVRGQQSGFPLAVALSVNRVKIPL